MVDQKASPSSGPSRGGTVVTITGSGFNPRGDLRCRFGLAATAAGNNGTSSSLMTSSPIVYAAVVSSTAVQCTAPPSTAVVASIKPPAIHVTTTAIAYVVAGLYLSFDGGEFIDTGFTFSYYPEPRILKVQPTTIPENSGR